jgi:hypothetical protein
MFLPLLWSIRSESDQYLGIYNFECRGAGMLYLLHGAEYYLKSWLSLSLSKKYPFFMEPEGSSSRSQKPSTGLYPEPPESSSPDRSLSP